jgi:hypothetical protein
MVKSTSNLTQEQAIALSNSEWWKTAKDKDIVKFQLFEDKLCMPFGEFHRAVEKVLKRPVWTHEFAYPDQLRKEFLGEKPAPSFEDIISLIPAEKRMLVVVPSEEKEKEKPKEKNRVSEIDLV